MQRADPVRTQPAPGTVAPEQAGVAAEPQAIAEPGDRHDHLLLLRHAVVDAVGAGVAAVVAHQALEGTHPQHPGIVEGQGQHGAVEQRVHRRIAGADALHAAVAAQPVQAAAVGAEVHRVAAAGDGEHVVAAHRRLRGHVEVAEAAPVRAEHAQAAALAGHPDAVARVDVQVLHVVAAQRGGIGRIVAPDQELAPVVAGQAVAAGDPQIAVAVQLQPGDIAGRQPLLAGEHPEARQFRHRGTGVGAHGGQRQQAGQPPAAPPAWGMRDGHGHRLRQRTSADEHRRTAGAGRAARPLRVPLAAAAFLYPAAAEKSHLPPRATNRYAPQVRSRPGL
ncbi:hypothetical protein NB705_001946 [Xanthomonas sacchari]|nr:hypothetical protein [Xanthomonas sacchari]